MQFAPAIVAKLRERAARYRELSELIGRPEVVADSRRYPDLLREQGQLAEVADLAERLEACTRRRAEAEAILAEEDSELAELAEEDLLRLEEEERALDREIKAALVTEPEDLRRKVIVEIRAGTGGDEATLFVADLNRIYRHYFESKRWKVEEFDASPSEVGGLRDITFAVEGDGVWRKLRFESGTHRVQRVPQTETQGRIHTSAVTVAVLPEATEAEVQLKPEDLRIDTMRAGGPGGQSVNTTSSAVRITHLPTGTVVQCQDEKSQHKNKAKALRVLASRLLEAERQRMHAERAATRRSQVGTGDRSGRIRTYNWPQNRVTDHRLGENTSLEKVLDGKLDEIVDALEALDREERIAAL
jgi:peptide chain release factor 1